MPTGLIEHHCDVLILGDRGGETIQKLLHGVGIDVGHDQREGPSRRRVFDTTSVPGSTASTM